MSPETRRRALLVFFSLLVAWGAGELVMSQRVPRYVSQVNRLVRTPGAGLGELLPASPIPYRLERMRVEGDALRLDTADGPRHFSLKRSDRVRVVALGDSLTELWNLAGYHNWVDDLGTLAKVETVPVGVGGYNTAHEVAYLTADLSGLEADVLLLQMCPNDAEVLYLHDRESNGAMPKLAVCPTPNVFEVLKTHGSSEDQLWSRYEAISFDCRERTFGRFAGSRVLWTIDHALKRPDRDDVYGTRLVEATPDQRRSLAQLAAHASGKGMRLMAVLFPFFAERPQIELELFRRLLSEAKIPFLDLTPAFQRDRTLDAWRLTKPDPYHPNAEGHARAAQAVSERLHELGWLQR